ncbi:hypothetical protein JL107_07725 [Nakamurella flavida]|uniref:Lantibiotic dehydratase N-terminal domain-containing protein n=1 Tax=Nakamurella flavida TaxID=363630 RepID=A0A939C2S4_9ACTN|nr:hypothetical protein [Nakamurella flavida]MBM9476326.1 hypothetical protein [Nakamurella flavida]MDP9779573.1 hypothetical protein [Nakamurella flavida]
MRDLLVGRQGGVPVAALDVLAAPALVAAVGDVLDRTDRAALLGARVADDLHDLVPGLSPPLRRTALTIRRSVHAGCCPPAVAAAARALAPALPAPSALRLLGWVRLHDRLTDALATAGDALAGLDRGARAAITVLSEPDLLRGLAFASPAFATTLIDGRVDPRAGSRSTRTAVQYLTRAALKPSPFSSLGTLGLTGWSTGQEVPIGPDRHAGGEAPVAGRSSFRPLAMALHRACWGDPAAWLGSTPPSLLLPEVHRVDQVLVSLLPTYQRAQGVWFRQDEPGAVGVVPDDPSTASTPTRSAPTRSAPTSTAPAGTAPTSTARLAATDPARAVRTGAAAVSTPWSLPDPLHLAGLPDSLAGTALPQGVLKQVRAAADAEADLATATDARQVVRATDRLRAAAREVFAELGAPAPDWLEQAPLAHETVVRRPAPPTGGRTAVQRVERDLARSVQVAPAYRALVRSFVRRHGSGGRTSLLDFCVRTLVEVEARSVPPDLRPQPVGDLPRGHGSLARPASAVFFQTLPDDRVVLNAVAPAMLGSWARWCGEPALATPLGLQVRALSAARHPAVEVFQFGAAADWTTVQRPVCADLPMVVWGTERAAALSTGTPAPVELSAFTLRHDPATDTLQIDGVGGPAALVYTGAVPPYLLGGVPALLAMIADPWTVRLDTGDPHGTPTAAGVRAVPRVERAGAVLRRAAWHLAASHWPTRTARRGVPGLLEVERFFRRHDLPRECFVRRGGRDKPRWVSLDHPLTVLTQFAEPTPPGPWTITEALPGRAESAGATTGAGTGARPAAHVTEYLAVLDHG